MSRPKYQLTSLQQLPPEARRALRSRITELAFFYVNAKRRVRQPLAPRRDIFVVLVRPDCLAHRDAAHARVADLAAAPAHVGRTFVDRRRFSVRTQLGVLRINKVLDVRV